MAACCEAAGFSLSFTCFCFLHRLLRIKIKIQQQIIKGIVMQSLGVLPTEAEECIALNRVSNITYFQQYQCQFQCILY